MARKIKVKKEKEGGNSEAVVFVVTDAGNEIAWAYSPELAMTAALEMALNERDNLRKELEDVKKFKQSLREFLS